MKLINSLIAVAAPVALALSVGAAEARQGIVITGEPSPLTRTERVAFGDIDLATAQGERVLASRVRVAVRKVCSHNAEHVLSLLPCKRVASSDARPQIANAVQRARANPGLAMAGFIAVRAGL